MTEDGKRPLGRPRLRQKDSEVLKRANCLLSFDMTQTTENTVSNNSSIVVYVFIATGMYLLSHCLAMESRLTAAELLKLMFSLQPNPKS
jgi:hypothetical protein